QADRDQLFFPSKDRVRCVFMTVGFSSGRLLRNAYFFVKITQTEDKSKSGSAGLIMPMAGTKENLFS
ncbi:MAG: hypothetical protein K2L79_03560, partial [Bacteroidales bacterium]|nr:hypothetical protein [Bacteroidales bacterium]